MLPEPKLLRHSAKTPAARHLQPGRHRAVAGRDARPLRHRGEDRRPGHRPARDPSRAAPRARHQGVEGHPAQGRHRVRARLDRHSHPRARSRASRRSGSRCPTSATAWSTSATSSAANSPRRTARARGSSPLVGLARQGHRRQRGLDGPRAHAASAGRGHHRVGEVGVHQHDAVVDPDARHPQRGADGAGRPQARRAELLRGHPAPPHAGRARPAHGGQRARQPDP